MTDSSGKWNWAREFTRISPQSVTLLLAIAMLLYSQDRGIERLTQEMRRMTAAIVDLVNTNRDEQKFRQHEHDELSKALNECKQMGHDLSECQKRSR